VAVLSNKLDELLNDATKVEHDLKINCNLGSKTRMGKAESLASVEKLQQYIDKIEASPEKRIDFLFSFVPYEPPTELYLLFDKVEESVQVRNIRLDLRVGLQD
jgi:hypothetical protein